MIDNGEDGEWYWMNAENTLEELQHITGDYHCEIIEVLRTKLPDHYSIYPIDFVDDGWN